MLFLLPFFFCLLSFSVGKNERPLGKWKKRGKSASLEGGWSTFRLVEVVDAFDHDHKKKKKTSGNEGTGKDPKGVSS